jgi:hypothetical protein
MVARRANKGKTMLAIKGVGHRPDGGTRSAGCNFERPCGDIGVMIDKVLAPVGAELTDHADVRRSMDAQKVIYGRYMRFLYFNAGRDAE